MNYITVKEAGEKWGLGIRIVTLYCTEGRIDGAVKKGNLWLIPKDAVKPADRRQKKAQIQKEKESLVSKDLNESHGENKHEGIWNFQSLYENKELFVHIVKHFPFPIHICAPDGTMLLANEEFLKFAKITNPEKLYKKHNIIQNPALERWGIKEFLIQAFKGQAVQICDIKVPYQEIVERLGDDKEPVHESLFQNIIAFPIRDSSNRLLFIAFIFSTSRSYKDRDEIIKGKEYIDDHWKEDFDIGKLANTVHMSKYHYPRLFKQHTGISPYNYYQEIKLVKLKEKLCDINLSIVQVFNECGVDYNGKIVKRFKEKTGMTPSQYRAAMSHK
jgi:AraC family transcriptional regulator